jgi:enamine deaminase RidA (YjgF/YER057c/UK114 family)
MEIKRHEIKDRMSRAVIHNNTAYLCGQTSDGTDITEQTILMLEKVDNLLKDIGSDKTKILSATIYLSNMENFAGMNAVWDSWVQKGMTPARACVEAKMSRDTLLVEISVIAAV